ncbi:phage tail terminator family protein [Anoxybacillus eryuanensis]|uniref:phage tail terminator family protein n=1 Tax=Anoxybacillus eryuanensis TaxID=651866 RepID=UPI003EF8C38D
MEIKTLIIQQIKEVFGNVKVYDEKVKQGLQTPAFLVRMIQSEQERKLKGQVWRTYSWNVVYFPQSTEVDGECDNVFETFQTEFQYIANKYHVYRLEGVKQDDVLIITFDVSARLQEVTTETKMQMLGGVWIGQTN